MDTLQATGDFSNDNVPILVPANGHYPCPICLGGGKLGNDLCCSCNGLGAIDGQMAKATPHPGATITVATNAGDFQWAFTGTNTFNTYHTYYRSQWIKWDRSGTS